MHYRKVELITRQCATKCSILGHPIPPLYLAEMTLCKVSRSFTTFSGSCTPGEADGKDYYLHAVLPLGLKLADDRPHTERQRVVQGRQSALEGGNDDVRLHTSQQDIRLSNDLPYLC